MKTSAQSQTQNPESVPEKKPGFFGRLFQKLDNSMKQKAEEKSQQGCCCDSNDNDSKGGKCC